MVNCYNGLCNITPSISQRTHHLCCSKQTLQKQDSKYMEGTDDLQLVETMK